MLSEAANASDSAQYGESQHYSLTLQTLLERGVTANDSNPVYIGDNFTLHVLSVPETLQGQLCVGDRFLSWTVKAPPGRPLLAGSSDL
jgi:hypothetical protein